MCKRKSGMFCFRKKIIILFKKFPSFFFSSKNTTCLSILILTLWTLLWIILEKKTFKKYWWCKNGKNIWGEKFIISNQSFLFSKFSIQCQPFPPFGCARFWPPPPQFRESPKSDFYFLLSVLLIPLLKFGMWLFQFPPHF